MNQSDEAKALDFSRLQQITFEDDNTAEDLLRHLFATRSYLIKSIEDEKEREPHPPSRRIQTRALLDHDVSIIRLLKMLQDRGETLTEVHRDFFETFARHWFSLTVNGYRAHHYFDWASIWKYKNPKR